MSSIAQKQSFPWHAIRGPATLGACYIVAYNVTRHVNHLQWWFPFGLACVAFMTGLFDKYDKPMIGSPWGMNNITWFILTLGVPIAVIVGGIVGDHWLWIAGGLLVLGVNALLHFGFREQGLPGTIVVVCLLAIAAL